MRRPQCGPQGASAQAALAKSSPRPRCLPRRRCRRAKDALQAQRARHRRNGGAPGARGGDVSHAQIFLNEEKKSCHTLILSKSSNQRSFKLRQQPIGARRDASGRRTGSGRLRKPRSPPSEQAMNSARTGQRVNRELVRLNRGINSTEFRLCGAGLAVRSGSAALMLTASGLRRPTIDKGVTVTNRN
jgi:hypothetical protein